LPDQHDFAVMNYGQYEEMIGETVGYTLSDCERNEPSVENKKYHKLHRFLNNEEEIVKDILLDSYNMITKILKCKPKCKISLGRPIKSCKDLSVMCIICLGMPY
jgi:hypothetical protein